MFVPYDGQFYQTGVVSWGVRCSTPGNYGVYARVSFVKEWIEDIIASGA